MNKDSNKKFHWKVEIIFYIVLAAITAAILLWYFLKPASGNVAEVRVSGKVIGTYPLNQNKKVTIEGKGDGKNILIISDGKARMEEADCPDGICVKKGEISRVSESIICLPHEVVVEIKESNRENNEVISKQKEDNVDVIAK